jgi:hypothetical protein
MTEILALLCVIAALVLRVRYDRMVQSWIDAGLIKRKPRELVRRSRYG